MTKPTQRIAKRLSEAGLCSRREAERWIAAGRVAVNGSVIDTPATLVNADDEILVDGAPIPDKAPTRVFRYHKPAGLITTNKDEKNRETIFDHLPKTLPRTMTIGRLDMNTEGLLLLTTSGALARHLELPETGWTRRYRVRVFGHPTPDDFKRLEQGMTVNGITYGSISAKTERQQGNNTWLEVGLTEGKNREIRNVFEALGLKVNRLIRISYGPFQLGKLPPGAVEEIRQSALKAALGQKGKKLL